MKMHAHEIPTERAKHMSARKSPGLQLHSFETAPVAPQRSRPDTSPPFARAQLILATRHTAILTSAYRVQVLLCQTERSAPSALRNR
jgi:hypothetical protein